jgi:uncharacterized oxidoreductase
MKTNGNTILITGGGSGIGRGLAESLHALGNQVIIAGRRKQMLDETTAANPGMKSVTFDIADAASIRTFAAKLAADYPALNALINNAGIMRPENLQSQQADLADAEAIITTNLLGPIRLTAALQPTPSEICVENVKRLRFAAENDNYDAVFNGLNEAMASAAN